jgi:hypothetical protein
MIRILMRIRGKKSAKSNMFVISETIGMKYRSRSGRPRVAFVTSGVRACTSS